MRIIAGIARGREIEVPLGLKVRPTADRVRESIFNVIQMDLLGADVLDIYAGSGSLGLEALSRGANSATFVEKDNDVCLCLESNLKRLGFWEQANMVQLDAAFALSRLSNEEQSYDFVFLDAPYKDLDMSVVEAVEQNALLKPKAWILVEHDCKADIGDTESLTLFRRNTYGKTDVSFFHKKGEEFA